MQCTGNLRKIDEKGSGRVEMGDCASLLDGIIVYGRTIFESRECIEEVQ